MAKRRYSFDEAKHARFLKEGRGHGVGADYRPWLTVHDVSSSGRSTRIRGRKSGREHHLLSDIETGLFLLLDWSDSVTDIREQFPLDRDKTRRIAADMGVRHPFDTESRTDIVMTTDFVVDVHRGDLAMTVARSAKPAKNLNNVHTLEKQEIERRYWQTKGVEWGLVTERDLPSQRIKNLRWLHEMQSLQHMMAPGGGSWSDLCGKFLACLSRSAGMSVKQFIRVLENTQGFAVGEGLTVLRHLAANKRIAIDLDAKFGMDAPVDLFGPLVSPPAAQPLRETA